MLLWFERPVNHCHKNSRERQSQANNESNAVEYTHAKQSPSSLADPPQGFSLHICSSSLRTESFDSLSPQLWIVASSYPGLSLKGRGKEN